MVSFKKWWTNNDSVLKKIIDLVLLFFACVTVCLLLLIIASFIPQGLVEKSYNQSIPLFESERSYPLIGDYEQSSKLDNWADSLMLEEAVSLDNNDISSVLKNPIYFIHSPQDILSNYSQIIYTSEPTGFYVRYWMGFRVPIRIMLSFINYYQIRKLLSLLIYGLMITTVVFVSRKADIWTGVLYGFSIMLIKPQVICNSMLYSCCAIILMVSVFFIPYITKKKWESQLFLLLGMITMFFDFYTYPLTTLGYPLCFFIIISKGEGGLKKAIKLSALWLCGYSLMWISKLSLVAVFTEINGLENGLSSFAMRTGINKRDDLLEYYDYNRAFKEIIKVLIPDVFSLVLIISIVLIILGIVVKNKKLHFSLNEFRRYVGLVVPVVIWLFWVVASAQPVIIHVYDQYRNFSMIAWCMCMLVYKVLIKGNVVVIAGDN